MSRKVKSGGQSLGAIFLAPMLIAAVSIIGLIAALVGNGAYDLVSWVTLAIPVVAVGWALRSRRS